MMYPLVRYSMLNPGAPLLCVVCGDQIHLDPVDGDPVRCPEPIDRGPDPRAVALTELFL